MFGVNVRCNYLYQRNINYNMDTKKQLTRIPQSLTHDYRVIERAFGNNGKLITDLLIFASNVQMHDVFGNICFSLDDFCKKMGYKKSNLQVKLPDKEKAELLGKQKDLAIYQKPLSSDKFFTHIIENRFECALWAAMTQNLVFVRSKPNGSASVESIQLIKKLDIDYDHTTNKVTKRLYSITLGSTLKDFLFTQYNLIELKDYRNIPNYDGYRMFYMYLSRMIALIKYNKSIQEPPYYRLTVDQLAEIFNYTHKLPSDRKKAVRSTLDKINSHIEHTKFIYEFIKDGGQFAYTVQFQFSDEILAYFDEKSKAIFTRALMQACESQFIKDNFKHIQNAMERAKAYTAFITQEDKDGNLINRHMFWDWFSSDDNMTIKREIYKKVYYEIFKVAAPEKPDIYND